MRLSIISLLALAATGLATDPDKDPKDKPKTPAKKPKPSADPECEYKWVDYTSDCHQGNDLFCDGNGENTGCLTPTSPSLDDYANWLNVDSCVGKKKMDSCKQYHCCKKR
ncbi:hypothetical protein FKW77_005803 [Venturia effusa]|uniref:Hydrophobin n=1 Tax=Venturia effusa TaxID=50376 RepID=A0A517L3D4_9PEZI|nr:hypothetical protein FKW77_005803 [Venturia effusa]